MPRSLNPMTARLPPIHIHEEDLEEIRRRATARKLTVADYIRDVALSPENATPTPPKRRKK